MGKFMVFSILGLFSAVFGKYDENFARYKTWPMASATFGSTPENCIKENFANASLVRQITIPCDQLKDEDTCSGFTAVSYSDKAIILALRGSQGWLQVADEVILEMFKNKTKFPGSKSGYVQTYFYTAFLDLWNAGMRDDFLSTRNANPDYELWVTGHSLGAAMASLAAGYIAALGYVPGNKIKLVTYGQPRVGDGDHADYMDATIPYAYRIVHQADCVPHLPPVNIEWIDPELKNYTHHQNEVWYNNNMAVGQPHVECEKNESDKCSDQLEESILGEIFDLKCPDHDYYFNISTGFAVHGCKNYNPNPGFFNLLIKS